MVNTHLIGRESEELAIKFLKSKSYNILETNYYTRFGEIDIIAQISDSLLVFIEVKSDNSGRVGYAGEKVNFTKIQHIQKTALHYTSTHSFTDNMEMRFDVITLFKKNNQTQIEHYENAFIPNSEFDLF